MRNRGGQLRKFGSFEATSFLDYIENVQASQFNLNLFGCTFPKALCLKKNLKLRNFLIAPSVADTSFQI